MGWVWVAVVVWVLLAVPIAVVLGVAIRGADRQELDPSTRPLGQVGLFRAREHSGLVS